MLDECGGHDQARHENHHQQDPLVESGAEVLRVGGLNLEKEQNGDEASRRDVQQREQLLTLEQQQENQPNREQDEANQQAVHQDIQVAQSGQRNGHSKQHEKERSNDKCAFKGQQMVIVVKALHALVVQEVNKATFFLLPSENAPIAGKENPVVVEHQSENQNQNQG